MDNIELSSLVDMPGPTQDRTVERDGRYAALAASVTPTGSVQHEGDESGELDLEFYRLFNEDLIRLNDLELLIHWRAHGRKEGRPRNLASYLEQNPDEAARLPEGFSVNIYRRCNRDLSFSLITDLEYIRHYLLHGYDEQRRCTVGSGDLVDDLDLRSCEQAFPAQSASDGFAGYRDVSDILRRNGITSDLFLTVFDSTDYMILHKTAGLRNEVQCIRHFAEIGRAELTPIALDWQFDVEFYREMDRSVVRLQPADAYLHWLNEGMGAGIRPNPVLFMRDFGLRNVGRMPAGFLPDIYAAANPAIAASKNRWQLLQHVIEYGVIERRAGFDVCPETLDIYLAVGDRLSVGGHLAQARAVYEQILACEPEHRPGLQHYADCLLRQNEHFHAAIAYRRNIESGGDSVWTHLNLSKALASLGRHVECSAVLSALHRRIPGDMNVRRQAQDAAARSFDIVRAEATWLAENGFFAESRDRMRVAVGALVAHYEPAVPAGPVAAIASVTSILMVAETSLPQCKFYRVQQKIEQLASLGMRCRLVPHSELVGIGDMLPFVEAVIFYRLPATPEVVRAITAARRAGLPTFYDIDDPVFDGAHFPDTFESYGGLISNEVYAGLVTGTVLYERAMALCDYGIASTSALRDIMAPLVRTGTCFLHPNAMGAVHERMAVQNHHRGSAGPVRLFYGTGTKAHNEDFDLFAAPALARLFDIYGDGVELTIVGFLTLPACLKPHENRVRRIEPIWDVEIYWRILSQMDVNIAVLKPGFVADCKSEIKWLEAAMLGVPTVATATRTFRECSVDGQTALLVESEADWFMALERLVADPGFRRELGEAARTEAVARYSLDAASRNLASILQSCTTRPADMPRREKVVIVNVFFPPQAIGGATRVVADNLAEMKKIAGDTIEFEVFTTTEGGVNAYELECYDWEGTKVTAVTAPSLADVDRNPSNPAMAELFGRYLDHAKPDMIHFHCIQRLTAAICGAAAERDIPYVITPHDGWWISEHQFLLDSSLELSVYDHDNPGQELSANGPASFYRMQELMRHMRQAERILPVSKQFCVLYERCGLTKLTSIENGVSELTPLPPVPSPDRHVRLLYAGGLEPHKGFNLVKAAFLPALFENLSLTVVDHSMAPGGIRTEFWGNTPVTFIAKIAQADVASLYARTDVLLAPSVWPESYGLIAREATLCGCWVVASDRGAIGGDVTPANGVVIDVTSPDALIEVLTSMDSDPERFLKRVDPAAAPRRRSRDQAADLLDLYRRILVRPDVVQ